MAAGQMAVGPLAAAYLCERFDTHLHPLLRVGRLPMGSSEEEQRRASDLGRQDLVRRELLDLDSLHPFLDDAWQLLARPPLAVGLAVRVPGGTDFNAVLVEHGRSTVQAYQEDGEDENDLRDIVLSLHEHGGPAGNALNLLGRVAAGRGGSVSVPAEQLKNATQRMRSQPNGTFANALAATGIRSADAQLLAKAADGERKMEGTFSVRTHDPKVNRTHTLPFGLQFFVTDEGGYLAQTKPGRDGRDWFTLAPADQRKLIAQVNGMARLLPR